MSASPPILERGVLPRSWSGGGELESGPPFIVHAYNLDFYILRQAGRTSFEKPFVYLLFGNDRALLLDTGAPGVDLAAEVASVVARWRLSRSQPAPPLVVGHTHGHDDHVAGDALLAALPCTTVVGTTIDAVSAFFHIASWPDGVGAIDLGFRVLDVIPAPGHDPASVVFYDRRTGILMTGDVLYPGRLYVRDAAAFRASVKRLAGFTRRHAVTHILGAHVENTGTPYVDYGEGTTYQPEEHALELGRAHLLELDDALDEMGEHLERKVLRDFSIVPVHA
jgi:hydroxyacylglutathione hydrolase